MFREKLKEKPWYPLAVAICIGVLFYVILSRFDGITDQIKTFIGYFKPLILGLVLAYIINPLTNLFYNVLVFIKAEKIRKILGNALAFIIVIAFLAFTFNILIPQLIDSIQTLSGNLNTYVNSIDGMLARFGVSKNTLDLSRFVDTTEGLLSNVMNLIGNSINDILTTSVNVGKGIFRWIIAFILSIYLISEKETLRNGMRRLMKGLFGEERYEGVRVILHTCDEIFSKYIIFNVIDSIIIGALNAVIMVIFGMPYIGLISIVVAITNIVPTFGPVAGGAIGALILLMEKPRYALIFIIITLGIQILDGYIIKPKLFGNSLGVSGLFILVGIIAGGNMFGIVGILVAIPCVAVLDFIYGNYIIPALEKKRGITPPPEEGKKPKKQLKLPKNPKKKEKIKE